MLDFLNHIFNEGEKVCFSEGPFNTTLSDLKDGESKHSYVTLNPLKEGTSRLDENVSEFRNFLVEFDHVPLKKQLDIVANANLPYTTRVFSGNKSYHFVISLAQPTESREEYNRLVRWIYAAVPLADRACKNPSRFTRLGNGTHSNKEVQRYFGIPKRCTKAELLEWLSSQCEEPVVNINEEKQMADEDFLAIQATGYRSEMHRATKEFCKTGGRTGYRHRNIYIAACNLRDCYYTLEEAKFLLLKRIQEIYEEQGKLDEVELKERAVVDAYQCPPRLKNKNN